jgi:hypothetical protein
VSIWTDIVDAVKGGNSDVQQVTGVTAPTPGSNVAGAVGAAGSAPGALSGVAGAADALSAFFAYLTNAAMWRSLGWLLLGVVLMIAGIALFLKDQVPPGAAAALAGL